MTNDLLGALLNSYQRNNTILLNLLKALPEGTMNAKALPDSAPIAVQFSHIHQTRLFWLEQTAPEFAETLASLFHKQGEDYLPEFDPQKITTALVLSSKAVTNAVKSHIETDAAMKGEHASYDHPVFFLQHMLWHEGYHVGQIKLALKAAGHVLSDKQEEKAIWSLWRTEVW
jgi:uncharacterized damage-inducible protein DinB